MFDIAVSPEFEVKLSKKDKITKHIIKVDEEMQNRYVSSYKQRFGQFEEAKKSTAESLLTVGLIELNENGEVKENGISIEEGSISVKAIKDEKIKKSFTGIKPGTVIDTDLKTAFPNDTELASLLKVTKEEVESMSNLFRVSVAVVKEYKEAEMNQDFFDKCFGEGVVN